MKAQKVTIKVVVETLHIDSVPALLHEIAHQILSENISGVLCKEDGDNVKWEHSAVNVEF